MFMGDKKTENRRSPQAERIYDGSGAVQICSLVFHAYLNNCVGDLIVLRALSSREKAGWDVWGVQVTTKVYR